MNYKTDETQPDYVTETREAMQMLTGYTPLIHKIERTTDLPGGGLYKMFQLKSAEDVVTFQGSEAWLLESKIIKAWYLFVPFVEAR